MKNARKIETNAQQPAKIKNSFVGSPLNSLSVAIGNTVTTVKKEIQLAEVGKKTILWLTISGIYSQTTAPIETP